MFTRSLTFTLLLSVAMPLAAEENDRSCKNENNFAGWLHDFKKHARTEGVSERTLRAALDGVSPDEKIIRLDRRQNVFAQDFLTFSGRMVNAYRLKHGAKNIARYADTFERIQQDFGVPAEVISAFWGLETDYGANTGNMSTIRSLTTLAWDCRRPALFREQLMAALKIIDRGDLSVDEMQGAWAGELGQTQFLPSEYYEKGVDYDNDGRVDLIDSTPDVLASTARVIQGLGWQPGQPWLEEVRVPLEMPWEHTGTDTAHSLAQWSSWGVTKADGSPLDNSEQQASLLLLMGRNGPAFLAYPNFTKVYLEWNNSLVYSTTAAYFATRLAGAGKVDPGRAEVMPLTLDETKSLQTALERLGHDVGGVDGIIGAKTRAAVRYSQLELGLPADGYPDQQLLASLDRLKPLPAPVPAPATAVTRAAAPQPVQPAPAYPSQPHPVPPQPAPQATQPAAGKAWFPMPKP
jgi:lytic murein transglycosylase